MEKDKFLILSELYQSLKDEQELFLEKVNTNANRIEEINLYVQSILEKEDSDYKVFSPRNIEGVGKEQIERLKIEKSALETENENNFKQINKIGRYIKDLSDVLEESPNKTEDNLPALNFRVMDIQEKERQRIARDLHDVTLQNLTHLVHKIELSSLYIDQDVLKAKLELAAVTKNLRTSISDIRNIIFDLHPMSFDDLGLKDSLLNFFTNIMNETDFKVVSDIGDIDCQDELILITIFRVIQEACMNAVSHSGGNRIEVKVKREKYFCKISIQDNGKGFQVDNCDTVENHHFGLTVMKERISLLNGKIKIESSEGTGTKIGVYIPIT